MLAEIGRIAPDKRIRVIVDTDDDAAHIGGNAKLATGPTPTAQRAAVIAHENASLRIATAGLSDRHSPTDTFFRGTRELFFNDEPIEIIHVPAATSDGDVLVFFRKSDVVVTGGVIEDLTYPVIRLDDGGSVNGTLAALNRVLDLTVAEWRAQGGTMVIPNRGRIYDEGDVAEYRDMVTIVRDRVQDAIDKGLTLEQVEAARLARDYDGRYAAASRSRDRRRVHRDGVSKLERCRAGHVVNDARRRGMERTDAQTMLESNDRCCYGGRHRGRRVARVCRGSPFIRDVRPSPGQDADGKVDSLHSRARITLS